MTELRVPERSRATRCWHRQPAQRSDRRRRRCNPRDPARGVFFSGETGLTTEYPCTSVSGTWPKHHCCKALTATPAAPDRIRPGERTVFLHSGRYARSVRPSGRFPAALDDVTAPSGRAIMPCQRIRRPSQMHRDMWVRRKPTSRSELFEKRAKVNPLNPLLLNGPEKRGGYNTHSIHGQLPL